MYIDFMELLSSWWTSNLLSPFHSPSQSCGCFARQQCSPQGGGAARADGGTRSSVPLSHQAKVQWWRCLSLFGASVIKPLLSQTCHSRCTLHVLASSQMTLKKNQNALTVPRLWAALAQRRGERSCSWTLYPVARTCVVWSDAAQKGLFYLLGSCAHSKS